MDEGFPGLRQNTPDACGETQEMKVAPPADFNMLQNCALVLPLLSECQRLVWVHLNQVDLQLDGRAELDKAFDGFPYLTQKQTAVLARRCSLHPDQVKVWFMVQRLRYGISWDYKDIQEVRRKFKSSQEKIRGKGELENQMGGEVKQETSEKKEQKKGIKKSGVKKAGKIKVEQSSNMGTMMGGNVTARDGKMMLPKNQEEDSETETAAEVKRNTQKRRRRMAVTNKIEKREMEEDDDGFMERAREVEIRSYQVTQKKRDTRNSIKSETKSIAREKREMLQLTFSNCQYPNGEDFDRLTRSIGIPRPALVQWFSDTRYYIKRGKPGWMRQEQHSRALANIRYRQLLTMSAKPQLSKEKQHGRGSLRGSRKFVNVHSD
ncbi:homeobox and leucine zipper encoding b [Paralichthys olivaceus]|uniref:homeobox and leucine zipper encoding b n=1 Tax=Paralichthys olivaceus TaxID=8255 RepID=UPI00375062AA